jgi:HSP20 family protein
MAASIPRLFGDISQWLDADLPLRAGHLVRMEDHLTDTEYQLRAELPGMEPEKDIQVRIHDGVLRIDAERREQARDRSEFRYGVLHRSVRLPVGADEAHVSATYSRGILRVTIPLKAARTGRAIDVSRG